VRAKLEDARTIYEPRKAADDVRAFAPIKTQQHSKENIRSRHYTPKSPRIAAQLPDPPRTAPQKWLTIAV
jgi:hypothetical protein